jgi:hypothetical protein
MSDTQRRGSVTGHSATSHSPMGTGLAIITQIHNWLLTHLDSPVSVH